MYGSVFAAEDRNAVRIVLLYKGKAHRRECANYTALIGILATSGKINIKVLIS